MRKNASSLVTIVALVALLASGCKRGREASVADGSTGGNHPSVSEGEAPGSVAKAGNGVDPQAELARRIADYELEGADKSSVKISSLRGKAILLNVWATWCGPCRAEIPQLNQLTVSHGMEGLEVIGISIDAPGSESQVLAFAREQQIKYRMAFDAAGRIAGVMHTTVVPTSVLLDREGNVVSYITGPLDTGSASFQQALRQALQK